MTESSITAPPTAERLYAGLEAAAKGNKQRMGTLYRLKKACDALVAAGRDFALRDIEAYCKGTFKKGPNAQSLSNDKSLRAYVDARRAEADLRRRGRPRSPLDQDIESIADPDLRSRMRMLAEDYRLTQKRFRILTEGLAKLDPPLDLDQLLRSGKPAAAIAHDSGAGTSIVIDAGQIEALDRMLVTLRDVEKLNRAGLMIDAGDVVGRGLRETVFEDRDIALLEHLLAALRNSQ